MDTPTGLLDNWQIAVVDDDADSLLIIRLLLQRAGATVHEASNGHDGLAMIRLQLPILILTDLSMPVMDGWQMIASVKSDPATAHIPIIALTAHAMMGDRQKALAAGCHNYIPKPILVTEFLPQIIPILNEIPSLAALLTLTK
jgi:CheY-like chemotaxis protein